MIIYCDINTIYLVSKLAGSSQFPILAHFGLVLSLVVFHELVSFLDGVKLSSFGSHTKSELDAKALRFFLLYFELVSRITVIRVVFTASREGSGQGRGGIRVRIVVVRGFANSGWAGFFGSVGTGRHEMSLL